MRDDFKRFEHHGAQIVAVAPERLADVQRFWREHALPFVGLADPERRFFESYGVESTAASLGQKPGLFILDAAGAIRLVYIGAQQWQIPENEQILGMLKSLP